MATIQGIYIALFGRPADPLGLEFFSNATNDGADLTAIGDLAATAEYQDRFQGASYQDVVTDIYQALFGRNPDLAGLSYFVNALTSGDLTINNVAIAILDGAQGADKVIVDNKIAAAEKFTTALDTPDEVAAYRGTAAADVGRDFISKVTGNSATVPTDAAVAAVIKGIVDSTNDGGTGAPGTILTLTAANDLFTPQGTGSSKTTDGDDTIRALTAAHINSGDVIDGGKGHDTLVAVVDAAVANNLSPTLVSVESVKITNSGAAIVTFDLVNTTGATQVTNVASTSDLTFSNISKGVTLGLEGAIAEDTVFAFKAADVGGLNDAATLAVKSATVAAGKGTTIDGIEKLTVTVDGNSGLALGVAGAQLQAITVTGNGNLGLGAVQAGVTTIDASGLAGGVTATAVIGKFTGGQGADNITLAAAANNDTIIYNSSNVSLAAHADTITNFQFGGVTDVIDVSAFKFDNSLTNSIARFTAMPNEGAKFESLTDNKVAAGTYYDGANTFVFFDINGDGVFNANTDLAVKLVGGAANAFTLADIAFA